MTWFANPGWWGSPNHAALDGGGGGAYVGPGDKVPGATAWWGLRAYSLATIGTNAIKLQKPGPTSQDFATIAGGGLDLAAIATFLGGATGTIIAVYDQTGNGFHANTLNTAFPTYNATILAGGKPVIDTTAGADIITANTLLSTINQPFSMSGIARRVSGGQASIMSYQGNPQEILFGTGANTMGYYVGGGSTTTVAAADGAFHDIQVRIDGASSSVICLDGVDTTGLNAQTAGGMISGSAFEFPASASGVLNGYVIEGGFWPFGFSPTNRTDLANNQKTFWGYR